MHIRSKDTVVVITGKDKGKEGKVLVASPKTGKVVVEGVAIATKHQKPRQQGVPGGIVKKEAAIDASNVMLVCPKCKNCLLYTSYLYTKRLLPRSIIHFRKSDTF